MENFKQKLPRIKTLLFDIDGVLTNGQVLLMENGDVVRNMNSKDGFALRLAARKGYRIAIYHVEIKIHLELQNYLIVFLPADCFHQILLQFYILFLKPI